jgi:hypothetical protein
VNVATSADRASNRAERSESSADKNQVRGDHAMPASDEREGQALHASSSMPLFKANPSLSPYVRAIEPPDDIGSDRQYANALPPEADGANPLTLGPDDPKRESDEGEPYLDDANPYGRRLVNRQNRPMGGVGVEVDPNQDERPNDRTEA